MALAPHPRYSVFKAWFANNLANTVVIGSEFYRVAGPRFTAAAEILKGIGAFKAGGRWNAPEVMHAVYLSEAPETAAFESNEHGRYYSLPLWEGMPKVTVAVRLDAGMFIDLTNPTITATLPESMANLLAEDWRAVMGRGEEATTQAVGRAAFESGLKGLRLPSKPHAGGINLMVFPSRLVAGDRFEVLNPNDLAQLGR